MRAGVVPAPVYSILCNTNPPAAFHLFIALPFFFPLSHLPQQQESSSGDHFPPQTIHSRLPRPRPSRFPLLTLVRSLDIRPDCYTQHLSSLTSSVYRISLHCYWSYSFTFTTESTHPSSAPRSIISHARSSRAHTPSKPQSQKHPQPWLLRRSPTTPFICFLSVMTAHPVFRANASTSTCPPPPTRPTLSASRSKAQVPSAATAAFG